MSKHDLYAPQRISLHYAIPNLYLNRSLNFSKAEVVKRLEFQVAACLANDMICERQENESTIFELNGYFVTPQALDRLVQERLNKIQVLPYC